MSASLVGSEMCIRDSPSWAPAPGAKNGAPQAGTATRRAQVKVPHGSGRCLLYTSDAADDM
eukprot:991941-Alexandrium_andersonii.AAC.1